MIAEPGHMLPPHPTAARRADGGKKKPPPVPGGGPLETSCGYLITTIRP
jgi:hypothetical protein